ncbi:MAG: GAF domain-containing protein [Anaerolineae bacterium]
MLASKNLDSQPSRADRESIALRNISRILSRSQELNALGWAIARQLVKDLNYELVMVYLAQGPNAHLYPVALSRRGSTPQEEAALLTSLPGKLPATAELPPDIIHRPATLSPPVSALFAGRQPTAQSGVLVPLKRGETVIGLVGVGSAAPNGLTGADRELVSTVAAIMAPAVSNIQLMAEQTHERKISDTLRKVSATLVSSLELDRTLSIILALLEQLLVFDSAAIYLLTSRNRLKMVAGRGMPHEEVTMASSKEVERFPLDEAVVSGQRPITVADVRQDPRWTTLKGTEYIRAWLGVPLLSRDTAIGLVTVDRSTVEPFTPAQVTLATAFADYAAIAIENARLFSQVKAQQEQMRNLSNRVVEAQEEERRRISRELHDEMGQALTAIKLNLQMLLAGLPPDQRALTARINEVVALTNDSLQEIRRLAMDLRPSILDDLGLVPTLHWYQNQFERRSNTQLTLSIAPNLPRLAPNTETALYRVVQEALTNVSRHANAGRVEISLSQDDTAVYCSIIDDGQGFAKDNETQLNSRGVGLTSMLERVQVLNGQLSIESAPGQGTSISIQSPTETANKKPAPQGNGDDTNTAGR